MMTFLKFPFHASRFEPTCRLKVTSKLILYANSLDHKLGWEISFKPNIQGIFIQHFSLRNISTEAVGCGFKFLHSYKASHICLQECSPQVIGTAFFLADPLALPGAALKTWL